MLEYLSVTAGYIGPPAARPHTARTARRARLSPHMPAQTSKITPGFFRPYPIGEDSLPQLLADRGAPAAVAGSRSPLRVVAQGLQIGGLGQEIQL